MLHVCRLQSFSSYDTLDHCLAASKKKTLEINWFKIKCKYFFYFQWKCIIPAILIQMQILQFYNYIFSTGHLFIISSNALIKFISWRCITSVLFQIPNEYVIIPFFFKIGFDELIENRKTISRLGRYEYFCSDYYLNYWKWAIEGIENVELWIIK